MLSASLILYHFTLDSESSRAKGEPLKHLWGSAKMHIRKTQRISAADRHAEDCGASRGGVAIAAPAPPHRAWLLASVALALLVSVRPAAAEVSAEAAIATLDDGAAAEAATVDALVVTGRQGADLAKAELEAVPGTASVILNADVEKGRASNAEDVLAFAPGVFAAATSGNHANKIAIRGYGLNNLYQGYSLGLRYFYDGMPITGPGGTQEDLLNIAAVQYTEVLNGANAFQYGAISLGGAINFVTHTGISSPGFFASAEAGSWGHRKFQLSYGGATEDRTTDYYFSVLRDEREGFQANSSNEGADFILNINHRFSDRLQTQFMARHRWEDLWNGSTLTLAQIEKDPRLNRVISGRKKKGTTLLVSKTTYDIDDDSSFELGLAYNKYPLWNGWGTVAPQSWRSEDASLSLRYFRTGDTLFGRPLDTTLAYRGTRLVFGDVNGYDVIAGKEVFRVHTKYTGSADTVLSLSNELHLSDAATLSTGLSFIDIDRNVRIVRDVRTNTSEFPTQVNSNYQTWAPRIGLQYRVNPNLSLFGNVTRSIDPPVTWQMGSTGVPYVRPLEPQKAWTAEAGLRAQNDRLEGTLTVYRTEVKDELLTIIIRPATPTLEALTANSNASPTIHQGVEAGLTATIFDTDAGDLLTLRQSYNYSDFHYRDDPQFGGNELPSLPKHAYQAELMFQHHSGVYAAVNVRAQSDYYVDFANTLSAPSTTIWGARLGYEAPSANWKAFLDLRNIGDKHYAATANTAFDLKGVDSPNFYPGDGFSIYGGLSLRY